MPQPRSGLPRRHRVAIALSFAFFVAYFDRTNVAVLIADHRFVRDLGIAHDRLDQGLLVSAFLFPYGLSNIASGFLGDRIRARPVLLAAIASWTVIMIASGLARSFGTLLGLRILLGCCESIMIPACSLLVAQWFPDRERARANAAWLAGLFLAPAFSFPLLTLVIETLGWRASFMMLAGIGLAGGVPLVWFWTRNRPEEDPGISARELDLIRSGQLAIPRVGTSSLRAQYKTIFSNHKYWLGLIGYCGWTVGFWGISTFVPTYFLEVRHLSFRSSSLSAVLPWVTATVFVVLGAAVGDRLVRYRAVLWSGGYLVAALLCFLLLHEHRTLQAILLLSLAVGFLSGTLGPMWSIVQEMSTEATTGLATGCFNGITFMVGAAGPAAMGAIVDLTHSYSNGLYVLCIWIVLMACTVVPLWELRDPAH